MTIKKTSGSGENVAEQRYAVLVWTGSPLIVQEHSRNIHHLKDTMVMLSHHATEGKAGGSEPWGWQERGACGDGVPEHWLNSFEPKTHLASRDTR